jgi:hypothetical protein
LAFGRVRGVRCGRGQAAKLDAVHRKPQPRSGRPRGRALPYACLSVTGTEHGIRWSRPVYGPFGKVEHPVNNAGMSTVVSLARNQVSRELFDRDHSHQFGGTLRLARGEWGKTQAGGVARWLSSSISRVTAAIGPESGVPGPMPRRRPGLNSNYAGVCPRPIASDGGGELASLGGPFLSRHLQAMGHESVLPRSGRKHADEDAVDGARMKYVGAGALFRKSPRSSCYDGGGGGGGGGGRGRITTCRLRLG